MIIPTLLLPGDLDADLHRYKLIKNKKYE